MQVVSPDYNSEVFKPVVILTTVCLTMILHFLIVQILFKILSRQKPAVGGSTSSDKEKSNKKKLPKLEDLLEARDYTGAITLLEVCLLAGITSHGLP